MSVSAALLLIGVLLASAGGFIVVIAWDQERGFPRSKSSRRTLAYTLIVIGIAIFLCGVVCPPASLLQSE
jgi:hypothetical protein